MDILMFFGFGSDSLEVGLRRTAGGGVRHTAGLTRLAAELGGRGHPEYPFNHPGYSPTSRIPAADFTPFIVECLEAGDLSSVEALMEALIAGNPGLGTSGGWMASIVREVFSLPFSTYVRTGGRPSDLELRALFILASLGGGGRPFWLTDDKPTRIAEALCGYPLQFTDQLAALRDRANKFIVQMRRDTPYWESFPLFEVPHPTLPPLADGPWLAAFLGLSCGTRMHLLNLFRTGGGALDSLATYSIKQFGLDSQESASALVSAGLVEPTSSPEAFAAAHSKAELKELLERAGLQARSSWSKLRLSEELVTGAPDLAAEVASDSSLVCVTPDATPVLAGVQARASGSVMHFQLLCFVD